MNGLRSFAKDAGAALVTVLVMLAVLSTLAIVALDSSRFSLRRTANQAQMDQIRWYFLGAEAYAASRIKLLTNDAALARIDQSEWQGRPFLYPLEDGAMTLTLWDGSNCLNLNSLVTLTDDGEGASGARGQVQFARLLDLLRVRSGTSGAALVAALADWVDSDTTPSAGGAEDEAYESLELPYRTANTLIADVSEVERVKGFGEEEIAKIAPFVCVRPTDAPNFLNINSLRADNAVLMSTVIGEDLSLEAAREVIRDRPRGGWPDTESFFLHPRLSGLEISQQTRALFTTKSRYYVLVTQIRLGAVTETAASLIDASGRPMVVRRVFGVGAAGRTL